MTRAELPPSSACSVLAIISLFPAFLCSCPPPPCGLCPPLPLLARSLPFPPPLLVSLSLFVKRLLPLPPRTPPSLSLLLLLLSLLPWHGRLRSNTHPAFSLFLAQSLSQIPTLTSPHLQPFIFGASVPASRSPLHLTSPWPWLPRRRLPLSARALMLRGSDLASRPPHAHLTYQYTH